MANRIADGKVCIDSLAWRHCMTSDEVSWVHATGRQVLCFLLFSLLSFWNNGMVQASGRSWVGDGGMTMRLLTPHLKDFKEASSLFP